MDCNMQDLDGFETTRRVIDLCKKYNIFVTIENMLVLYIFLYVMNGEAMTGELLYNQCFISLIIIA